MPNKKSGKSLSLKDRRLTILLLITIALFIAFLGLKFLKSGEGMAAIPSPAPSINSQKNITGIYKGSLPCADCTSLEETIILAGTSPEYGTYIQDDLYIGKSQTPIKSQGTWKKINNTIIQLTSDASTPDISYFKLLDSGDLKMLDKNMQEFNTTFNQILTKQ